MEELVTQLGRHGLAIVFANTLLERIGVPIPALPLLVVAGALAARGQLQLVWLLAVAVFTPFAVDVAWFGLGRWRGKEVLRAVCRMAFSPEACVRQTEAMFERHGMASLVYGKFIPGYSIVVLPLAGAAAVPLGAFLLWDLLGNLLWAGSVVVLGFAFHQAIGRLLGYVAALGFWALVAVVVVLVLVVVTKWTQRRRFYKLLRLARISVGELQRLIDSGEPHSIVDVRTPRSFASGHIPGALRMTFEEIDLGLAALPLDRAIVLYCTCANEASAARVARALVDRGFTNVRPLEGGLESWRAAGQAVDDETAVILGATSKVAGRFPVVPPESPAKG
jgi:membrane protein DedA with SNARE-associated domain/rhodanese-related sulfurtransferase